MVNTGWKVVKSALPGALRALRGASSSGVVQPAESLIGRQRTENVASGYETPFQLKNSTIKSFPERSPLPPDAQQEKIPDHRGNKQQLDLGQEWEERVCSNWPVNDLD